MDYNENNGKLEQLDKRIRELMSESKEYYFTEYLQKMTQRVIEQKYQVDLLQDELERSYRLYHQRMKLAGVPLADESRAEEAQPAPVDEKRAEEAQPAPADENRAEEMQPVAEDESRAEEVQEAPVDENWAEEAQPVPADENQAEENQAVSRPGTETREADAPASGAGQPRTAQTIYTSANIWNPPVPQPAKKSGGEFVVGAVLLSILGGAFILTSLVILGMNYMNSFVAGVSLYATAALVTGVSEVFIYRKWKMLGSMLSSIGIGGLFLSTVVNYLALGNMPGWAAILATAAIMLFVVVLSRKRQSAAYRILGLIACYICFIPIQEGISGEAFCFTIGMIFLANLMCALIPVKKYETVMDIVHISANAVFAQIFIWRAAWCGVPVELRMVFFMGALVISHLLLVLQVKRQKDNSPGIKTAYGISALLYLFILYFETDWAFKNGGSGIILLGACLTGVLVVCLLSFLLLWKAGEKWFVYTFFNLTVVAVASYFGSPYESIFYLALLVLVKLLAIKKAPLLLKINDAVLTALICLEGLYFAGSKEPMEWLCAGLMMAGVLFSIPFISFWQNYYKLILTYTAAGFLAISMPPMLKLPIFAGVLFAGILLFNNIKRWQRENNVLFNALALSGEIICFLLLMNPVYRNAYLTYLCMLVFGLATIVLTFQEKYHMNFRAKSMITAVFLTYMALIVKVEPPVINSIMMMLIALVSVAAGFAERKKGIRIYGLVLSLLVCGKITLYDFIGAATLQKMVLFFVVGVIALVIAGIYIVLEKRDRTDK